MKTQDVWKKWQLLKCQSLIHAVFFLPPHWMLGKPFAPSPSNPFSPWKEQVGAKCVSITLCSHTSFCFPVEWRQAVSKPEAGIAAQEVRVQWFACILLTTVP